MGNQVGAGRPVQFSYLDLFCCKDRENRENGKKTGQNTIEENWPPLSDPVQGTQRTTKLDGENWALHARLFLV